MTKEEMIKKTLEQLNQFYPVGLYDWMYLNNKTDYLRLIDIENNIDSLLINDGSQDQLKQLLIEFWQIHKKNIREFDKSNENIDLKNPKLNYEQVRKERLEERVAT